jgi:hypothetical protein
MRGGTSASSSRTTTKNMQDEQMFELMDELERSLHQLFERQTQLLNSDIDGQWDAQPPHVIGNFLYQAVTAFHASCDSLITHMLAMDARTHTRRCAAALLAPSDDVGAADKDTTAMDIDAVDAGAGGGAGVGVIEPPTPLWQQMGAIFAELQ